jgi:hypothetical protein
MEMLRTLLIERASATEGSATSSRSLPQTCGTGSILWLALPSIWFCALK